MKLYSIGQVSAMIDVPIRTIRYYERIGLCTPAQIDEASGYRYYSIDDIFRLDMIRCLGRQLGMPLKTIEEYLRESGNPDTMKKYLREQAEELDAQILLLEQRKQFLLTKLEAIHMREETPPLQPICRHRSERQVYVCSGEVETLEEAMLFARKIAAQYGDGHERELYVLMEHLEGSFVGSSTKITVGIGGQPKKSGLTPVILEEGEYLSVSYRNEPGHRQQAVMLLNAYLKEHDLRQSGPIINGGSLLDMSSAFSKDYCFATEFLVK